MQRQYVFGDYVLSAVQNAFNEKTSWWISKKGYTQAIYCFSTCGTEKTQTKEVEVQCRSTDVYVKLFESCVLK